MTTIITNIDMGMQSNMTTHFAFILRNFVKHFLCWFELWTNIDELLKKHPIRYMKLTLIIMYLLIIEFFETWLEKLLDVS
jgi:hypothetical protein